MVESIFILIGSMSLFLLVVSGVLQALTFMVEQAQEAVELFRSEMGSLSDDD